MAVWLWGKCLRRLVRGADLGAVRRYLGGRTRHVGLFEVDLIGVLDIDVASVVYPPVSAAGAGHAVRALSRSDGRGGRRDGCDFVGKREHHELSHRKAGRGVLGPGGATTLIVTMIPPQSRQRSR